MRSRRVWLTASSCLVLAAAGCGGSAPEPRLPADVAGAAVQANRVASLLEHGRHCDAASLARRIQRAAIAAINARRIAPALQEELLSHANELVAVVPCRRPGSAAQAAERARRFAGWLHAHA